MAISAADVAALRKNLGLPPDPVSDQVWAERPWATASDVYPRLVQKANSMPPMTQKQVEAQAPVSTVSTPTMADVMPWGGNDNRTDAQKEAAAAAAKAALEAAANEAKAYAAASALFDTLGMPKELLDVFIKFYIETGDQTIALVNTRKDPRYDTYFPGNKRDDGSLKFSEAEYLQQMDSFREVLEDVGVNSAPYEHLFRNLIAGDKSPNEFRQQVNSLYDRVFNAPAEVMAEFGQRFGISNPTATQALGLLLNPGGVGQKVLDREINIAEITGQARRFGFNRRGQGEALANAGVSGQEAEQFYSQAATSVPVLSGAAGRANEGRFGIGNLESAFLLSDPLQRQRAQRIQRREQSLFSRSATSTTDRAGGLTGLGAR